MADLQAALTADVSAALTAEFGPGYAGTDPLIRPSAFADYQANVALALAKRLGRQPREVAAQIASHLGGSAMVASAEVSGPGFINITLRDSWLGETATAQLADPRLGVERTAHPMTVVVDYSGPNVAKELHAGHLRATGVGDAIVRVFEHLGNTVVRAAHLGDWGTQFGMLIEHAIDVGEQATYDQLAAGEFTDFYQAANQKFRSDAAFADRSRRRVVTLQAGEEQSLRLWNLLVTDSMEYLRKIYARLHITLTDADMDPESFYNPMLDDVCGELERMGIATLSDGALCAFPPGFTGRDGRPLPLILRKSDGGYGYAATDVAAIRYRLLDLHAGRIIYVVGSEQRQHLAMVMAVARQAGWLTEAASAEHAVIGLMTGPGGQRLRTRSGGQFKLAELIDEAVERAEEVIKDRYDDPELRAQIAEDVGVGALKYGDLSVARSSSYVLDFDRLLALTGNTGPYLQYAAARIRSIFARAGLDP
ncbi:MAG TPA: arginine--tRNA ligase, partial [Streptosporangiaceae bacterium]